MVYPSPNLVIGQFSTALRPDFVVRDLSGKDIGLIEVELGTENSAQIKSYEEAGICHVFSIVGKSEYSPSDLSLEELYKYLLSVKSKYMNTQKGVSLQLFCDLVKYYVIDGNFKLSNSRSDISAKMLSTPLIKMLYRDFKEENIIQSEQMVVSGKIKINTISKNGFSIRVRSRHTSSGDISLMNRTGGREVIYFPSFKLLSKKIPERKSACEKYAHLIESLGDKDIFSISEQKKSQLPLKIVESNFDKFIECFIDLC